MLRQAREQREKIEGQKCCKRAAIIRLRLALYQSFVKSIRRLHQDPGAVERLRQMFREHIQPADRYVLILRRGRDVHRVIL